MKTIRKTKAKRILSLLLALVMIISTVPLSGMSVFAAENEDFEYEILYDGTAEITEYNGTASDLVIPSEIDGYKVTSIGDSIFKGCTFLTNITIPDGVMSVGSFDGCTNLTNIEIPDSVTNIGSFKGCTNLENIKLSNNIQMIDEKQFADCTSLTSITIPESVFLIWYEAFYNCTSLSEIILPNKSLDIRNDAFNNTAFYNNNSNWENGVLYCGNHLIEARNDITGEYKIEESTIDIASGAFNGCTSLTDVEIPNTVEYINIGAFMNCTALESISIPNSVKFVAWQAFENCTSLKDVNIAYGVKDMGGGFGHVFSGCTNLTSIVIPGSLEYIDDGNFSNCTSLESVTLIGGVKSIGWSAFSGCTALKNVILPDTLKSIGNLSFSSCTSLTRIVIPESVTDINSYAFSDCPSLTIYGYTGTAAETYANENGFEFIALNKTVDESTGISVSEKELNIIPDGAQLKTEKFSIEDNRIVFDISLVKDGADVQPNGEVTVKIPVPESMDISLLKVYREEADGTFTDMNAYFANGYMVFTTDHFSKYILTTEEPSAALPGDINGDGKVTAVDARWVLQIAAGTREVTEAERKSIDLNKDGKVSAVDARWVLQAAAGIRVL